MSQPQIIELVGGIVAAVLAGIDIARSKGQSLTAWGVLVLGIVFILLAIK